MASSNDLDQTLAKCQAILGQCLVSADAAAKAAASVNASGYAPLNSPQFTGLPTVPTAPSGDISNLVANTSFIANMLGQANGIATLGPTGLIPVTQLPFSGLSFQGTWDASANSPHLTSSVGTAGNFYVVGTAGSTNLNGITTWVVGDWALFNGTVWQRVPQVAPPISNLPLSSLAGQATNTIVGNNTGSTAAPTALTTAQVAAILPAFTGDSGSGGVKGLVPAPASGDQAAGKFLAAGGTWAVPAAPNLSAYATLASPTFTGTPLAPTPSVDNNTTSIATTAFVIGQASASGDGTPAMDGTAARGTSIHWARADHVHPTDTSKAPLASPTFTGTPAAPTAAVDTNTTQLASTAFVLGQASAVGDGTPAMDGTAARGTSTHFARADHVHPVDTSRAPLASPTFTGVPAAPTAAGGTNTTQIATTAFVQAAIGSGGAIATPYQAFTTTGSQTVTIPTGATKCKVTMCAAGGGCASVGGGSGNAAGGGETIIKLLTGLTPGLTMQLSVGAAGNTSGGDGGNTTLSSGTQTITTLTANGGKGSASTGAGGTGGNGDINFAGGSKRLFQTLINTGCGTTLVTTIFFGGDSLYGQGGSADAQATINTVPAAFGAGAANSTGAGVAGRQGMGMIEWYP